VNRLAQQLDETLRTLDPDRASELESRVREALQMAEQGDENGRRSDWPAGYFEETAGKLAGEEFQRPAQGESPERDSW
jgi:hypothetical protein